MPVAILTERTACVERPRTAFEGLRTCPSCCISSSVSCDGRVSCLRCLPSCRDSMTPADPASGPGLEGLRLHFCESMCTSVRVVEMCLYRTRNNGTVARADATTDTVTEAQRPRARMAVVCFELYRMAYGFPSFSA